MEEMKKQAEELIQQAYNRGRKDGYEDWKNSVFNDVTIDTESFIKQGHDEAWEAVRKISKTESYKLNDIFGEGWFLDIFNKFSASEVIEKLHKYEKKQEEDKIKVGDEVVLTDDSPYGNTNRRAVIIINDDDKKFPYYIMLANGDTDWIEKDEIDRKTGRTFPEIVEVLKKLKEDKE